MRKERQASWWAGIAVLSAISLGCGERGVVDPESATPLAPPPGIPVSASLLPLDVFGIGPVGGQPCSAAEYRQFDFWVGNWDVFGRSSQTLAGTNEVKSKLDGCMVEENWKGAAGGSGRSLNAYDHASGTWSQMWVSEGGCPFSVLLMEGGFAGGSMTLVGTRTQPEGFVIGPPCAPPPNIVVFSRTDLTRWTPLLSGSVLQQAVAANDGNPLTPLPPPSDLQGLRYDRVNAVTPINLPPGPSFCPFRAAAQHFNFMIGTWAVRQGEGAGMQGTVTFTKDVTDCLIEEHLEANGGYEGISYNTFDVFTQQWIRTYVDNQGQRLFLTGGRVGNDMVLTGSKRSRGGQDVLIRVTWSPLSADEVRQAWDFSLDGGSSWQNQRVLRFTRGT